MTQSVWKVIKFKSEASHFTIWVFPNNEPTHWLEILKSNIYITTQYSNVLWNYFTYTQLPPSNYSRRVRFKNYPTSYLKQGI